MCAAVLSALVAEQRKPKASFAIREPDLAKSVQRYQLAVDQAKVRLTLAVAPMAWLMPAKMIISTESTIVTTTS